MSEFRYWECPDCGFDVVTKLDTTFNGRCSLCASDNGHDVMMRWRVATDADKPEGTDERKEGA